MTFTFATAWNASMSNTIFTALASSTFNSQPFFVQIIPLGILSFVQT